MYNSGLKHIRYYLAQSLASIKIEPVVMLDMLRPLYVIIKYPPTGSVTPVHVSAPVVELMLISVVPGLLLNGEICTE